jgi:hypothetical protein
MGLLTLLFRLPFLPVSGVIRLAEILRDEAERQLYDPAEVRRELEESEEAYQSGRISAEELSRVEHEVVGRLTGQAGSGPAAQAPESDER